MKTAARRFMIRSPLMAGLLCCAAPSAAAQSALALYSFAGSAGDEAALASDFQPAGAVAGAFARGPGLTPVPFAERFNSSGWTSGSVRNPNDCYTFTFTPGAGRKALGHGNPGMGRLFKS